MAGCVVGWEEEEEVALNHMCLCAYGLLCERVHVSVCPSTRVRAPAQQWTRRCLAFASSRWFSWFSFFRTLVGMRMPPPLTHSP